MERNSISVCMATCNGAKYIEEQLNSILAQLNPRDEIILVDDNSSDNTIIKIKEIKDRRIKIFRNQKRLGILKNFEKAILLASYDFIFLSDQDDIWIEGKVKYIMSIFQERNVDLINHDAIIIDNDKNVIHESMYEYRNSGPGVIKNFLKDTYMGSCMAFKREVAFNTFPMPYNIGPIHDAWIGICAEMMHYRVLFVKRKLIKYRRHDKNTTKKRKLGLILLNRIFILYNLLIFWFKYLLKSK